MMITLYSLGHSPEAMQLLSSSTDILLAIGPEHTEVPLADEVDPEGWKDTMKKLILTVVSVN